MKRILLFILILIMLFCMVGCSSVDYGIVKDKCFRPAYKTHYLQPFRIGKTMRWIPRTVSHSDSWQILVANEEAQEWWNVTEKYYNAVNVGDYVDRRPTD